jgi:hypothetical protein
MDRWFALRIKKTTDDRSQGAAWECYAAHHMTGIWTVMLYNTLDVSYTLVLGEVCTWFAKRKEMTGTIGCGASHELLWQPNT